MSPRTRTATTPLLWPGRRKGGALGKRAPLSYDVPFRHESVYSDHVKPAMETLKLRVPPWYSFRHHYASACAAAGYDIHTVAKWMGHERIQLTYKTYMHLFSGHHDMDRLDALASTAPAVQPIPMLGVGGRV